MSATSSMTGEVEDAIADISNLPCSSTDRMLAQTGKRMSVDSSLPPGHPMDPAYQPKILRQCSSSGSAKTMDDVDQELQPTISKILVVYTGGTIGMMSKGGGTA